MASRSDDTFRGARNLQFNKTIKNFVGQSDRVDFYKFRASEPIDFTLALNGLKANASVKLLNSGGAAIAASNRPGKQAEGIVATLNSGTYYVEVRVLGRRGNTQYNLRTSAIRTDNTIPTALDIGVLSTTDIKQGTVGTTDLVDFYKFTLTDIAKLDVRVNSSAQVRSIQLIRDQNNNGLVDNGEVFAPRPGSGLTPLDIPPGTYFIRVEGFSNVSSPYELTLVPTLFGGNVSPEPGNTLPLASNTLGVLSGTRVVKDYVGVLDATDIYRFTLNDLSNLQITRTGSSFEPEVQLIRDSNNNGLIDISEVIVNNNNFGILSDSANVDVPSGTYFIRVEPQINNFFSTSYELTLVGTPYGGNGLPDPGNTIPAARDLGALSGTSSLKEYVGALDSNDFYRFTLGTAANLQARVAPSSGVSLDLDLIQDANNNGLLDTNEILRSGSRSITTGITSLNSNLQAGTYFLRIDPTFIGSFSTNYELTLVTP
jgi:Bacterial pre-peptidase C-terminal domain